MVCRSRDSRKFRFDAFALSRSSQLAAEFSGRGEAVVEAGKNGERGHGVNQHAIHFLPVGVGKSRGQHDSENKNNLKKSCEVSVETWRKRTITRNQNNDCGDDEQ